MSVSRRSVLVGGLAVSFGLVGLGVALQRAQPPRSQVGLGALPPPTRGSCLECVEKHLGAALVLIGETRDGWPHRLRAIGHLHEAEDESQHWLELHNAIRAARKHYQQTGHPPDFDQLAQLAGSIRRGSARAA